MLNFTSHAIARMFQGGISKDEVEYALSKPKGSCRERIIGISRTGKQIPIIHDADQIITAW
jgi:hypothetical protein